MIICAPYDPCQGASRGPQMCISSFRVLFFSCLFLIVFLKAELLKSDLGCRKETSPLLVVHDKDTHTDRGSVRERATDTHIQSDADPDTDRH